MPELEEIKERNSQLEAALNKIEGYCEQVYQASLHETLSLQGAAFMVGAILGVVYKALGKEIEE